jgi:hypothetical protein
MSRYPIGKGMFIWIIEDVFGGDLQAIAERAVALGLAWVSVKVAHGESTEYDYHNPDPVVEGLVNVLHAENIQVWGWGSVYGDAPLPEAHTAIERIQRFNLRGWLIDAEGQYAQLHKAEAARQYMAELRTALPELPIGLCSYRFPSLHQELPWSAFLEACDFHAPQVYWAESHDAGAQLRRSVQELTMLKDLPVVPVGAAYREHGWQPQIWELDEFNQTAKELDLPGVTWWRWGSAEDLGFAEVIAGHDWARPGQPPEVDNRYRVTAVALNLRSKPVVRNNTKLAVLPHGHLVTKLGVAPNEQWWRVSTLFQQNYLEGFVHSHYLVPAADFAELPTHRGLAAVHLERTDVRIARDQDWGLASPLNEPGQPTRRGDTPQEQAAELTEIVKWLDVEQSLRYKPQSRKTFCNIYAYDYCFLAEVYLPRVWWTEQAIQTLVAGGSVPVRYGDTVSEMAANMIFQWLEEYGPQFGWTRTFDLTELQSAANQGQVAIICAQNKQLDYPGHICAVVPETAEHRAVWNGTEVTQPLQSQAGSRNVRYWTEVWWTSSRFRKYGYWKHA